MIGARGRSHALQRHLILSLFATKGNTHVSGKKSFGLKNFPFFYILNMPSFFRLKCRLISWSRASSSAFFFLLNWKANYPALTPNEHYQESAPSAQSDRSEWWIITHSLSQLDIYRAALAAKNSKGKCKNEDLFSHSLFALILTYNQCMLFTMTKAQTTSKYKHKK